MTTPDDGYDWFDALERFDIVFSDADDFQSLFNRLSEALGHSPSAAQMDTASFHFGQQRMQAVDLGFTSDRFIRQGQSVTQLRDRFGRFIAQGAQSISRRLAQGGG